MLGHVITTQLEYRSILDDRPSTYCRESSFRTTHSALHYSFIHSNHECESLLSAGIQLSLHLCNALNIINYVLQYGQKSIAGDLSRIVLACRSSLFVLHSSVSVVVKHYLLGRWPILQYLRTVASNFSKIKIILLHHQYFKWLQRILSLKMKSYQVSKKVHHINVPPPQICQSFYQPFFPNFSSENIIFERFCNYIQFEYTMSRYMLKGIITDQIEQ